MSAIKVMTIREICAAVEAMSRYELAAWGAAIKHVQKQQRREAKARREAQDRIQP